MWTSCPRNSTRYLTAPSYALFISPSEKTRLPFSRNIRSSPRVTTGIMTFVWEYLSIRSISSRQNDSVSEGAVFRTLGIAESSAGFEGETPVRLHQATIRTLQHAPMLFRQL